MNTPASSLLPAASSPLPAPPPLLTSRELAAHLAMSIRTLQELRDRGRIPFIRISPKCLRYNLAEVEQALGFIPAGASKI